MISPNTTRPYILYVALNELTIGAMLAQKTEHDERVVYYLSRLLSDVEKRYSPIRKLCLSMYYVIMKLKHYIGSNDVFVVSRSHAIKAFFKSPLLIGRISK